MNKIDKQQNKPITNWVTSSLIFSYPKYKQLKIKARITKLKYKFQVEIVHHNNNYFLNGNKAINQKLNIKQLKY